jgi:hypothetical protein
MKKEGYIMSAKFKISIEIENKDGTKTVKPVTIETEIPDIDDFMVGENFRINFDSYEKAVLMARKEVVEIATKQYLEEASKKNSIVIKRNSRKKKQ